MVMTLLKDYLEEHNVPYETIPHPETFTAPETAQAAHVTGKEFAKTVIVHIDDALAMAVVPANALLDLERLKALSGAHDVHLAQEEELTTLFPSCELGAMPPFGNLYGMAVYLHEDLDEFPEIVFNAGTHTDLIKMPFRHFAELVNPVRAALVAD